MVASGLWDPTLGWAPACCLQQGPPGELINIPSWAGLPPRDTLLGRGAASLQLRALRLPGARLSSVSQRGQETPVSLPPSCLVACQLSPLPLSGSPSLSLSHMYTHSLFLFLLFSLSLNLSHLPFLPLPAVFPQQNLPDSNSQQHILPLEPCTRDCTPVNLRFLICKVRVIIVPLSQNSSKKTLRWGGGECNGHRARHAVGTQRVGGRMKPLLVKEHLCPSEAPSCGKGQAHFDASGVHVPAGEADQQKKMQGQVNIW